MEVSLEQRVEQLERDNAMLKRELNALVSTYISERIASIMGSPSIGAGSSPSIPPAPVGGRTVAESKL